MASPGPPPFSFHCIICIEPFDFHERYPVVLPCGHTYLCACCANQIERCVECRMSLFVTPSSVATLPSPPSTTPPSPTGLGARRVPPPLNRGAYSYSSLMGNGGRRVNSYRGSPSTASFESSTAASFPLRVTETKVRFPLPRNLVLIDLMTAAAAASLARGKANRTPDIMLLEQPRCDAITNRVSSHVKNSPFATSERRDDRLTGSASPLSNGEDSRTSCDDHASTPGTKHIGELTDDHADCPSVDKTTQPLYCGNDDDDDDDDDDEEEEENYDSADDDERVIDSIRSAVSDYGTYVVRDKFGVFIRQAMNPSKDNLIANEFAEGSLIVSAAEPGTERHSVAITSHEKLLDEKPMVLRSTSSEGTLATKHAEFGCKIQIVSFRNGVAKLARGEGHIIAYQEHQLVKVGPPVDRVCLLEGMINSTAMSMDQLGDSLQSMRQQRENLLIQLQQELAMEENRSLAPVIQPPPPPPPSDSDSDVDPFGPSPDTLDLIPNYAESKNIQSLPILRNSNVVGALPPSRTVPNFQPSSPVTDENSRFPDMNRCGIGTTVTDYHLDFSNSLPFFDPCGNSTPDPIYPIQKRDCQGTRTRPPSLASHSMENLGCSVFFTGERYRSWDNECDHERAVSETTHNEIENENHFLSGRSTPSSPTASTTPDTANTPQKEQEERQPLSTVTHVPSRRESDSFSFQRPTYAAARPRSHSISRHVILDFRTGLSGHMALTSTCIDSERRPIIPRRSEIRMMGEHRGISWIKKIRTKALS